MAYTEPSLDTWTSLFLLVASQGLFLSFLLFLTMRKQERSNIWLGLIMFFFAITLVDYVGYWTRYNYFFPRFAGIHGPIVFLFGPLLYNYLRQLDDVSYGFRNSWKHFVPFLLVLCYRLPFFALPNTEKIRLLQGDFTLMATLPLLPYNFSIFTGLCIFHLAIYSFLIYSLWAKKALSRPSDSRAVIIQNMWYKVLWQLYTGFVASYFLYFVLVQTGFFTRAQDYVIAFSMSLFIYTVGYLGYRKPAIFGGRVLERVFLPEKYRHSSLTAAAGQSILKKLLQHMQVTKPYLENEFRMNDLANQLDISPHHLSQVINEKLNMKFSDFVNAYRIEEAKKLLSDPALKHKYIIDIAYTAGFNNKTTFNKTFKDQTGMSPTAFRKQQFGNTSTAIAS